MTGSVADAELADEALVTVPELRPADDRLPVAEAVGTTPPEDERLDEELDTTNEKTIG